MSGRLQDKVAIVTGAASGIGRTVCQWISREGAKVMVADRNIAGAEETLTLMNATPDTADMVDVDISDAFRVERMVQETVSRFGRLDVLVNGAAILIRTPPLVDVDEVLWDLTMETNVKGVFLCCKYAIPAMTANGGGAIVNISSMSGIRGIGCALRCEQSRGDSLDQGGSQPIHLGRRADQLHCPRWRGHAPDAGQHGQRGEVLRAKRDPSHGPLWQPR